MKIDYTQNIKCKFSDAKVNDCFIFLEDTFDHFAIRTATGVIYFSSEEDLPKLIPNSEITYNTTIEIITGKSINVTIKT